MSTANKTMKLNILPDQFPENPRKWCNQGTIVASHPRYSLSDEHGLDDAVEIIEDHFTQAQLEKMEFDSSDLRSVSEALSATGKVVIVPLYMYEHSGVALKTSPFSCRWDSGWVGFVFVSKSDIRSEFGWKRINAARLERVEGVLASEVAVFSDYLDGNVWGYEVLDEEDQVVDSCWGFIGFDPRTNGILGHLPAELIYQVMIGDYQRIY